MTTTQTIRLDLARPGISPRIYAVQGDNNTRFAHIFLFSNDRPWAIAKDAQMMIRYRKPDRTIGMYNTLADGTPACTAEANIIHLAFVPDMLSQAGDVAMVVTIQRGEQILSTFEMILTVQQDHSVGDLSSADGGYVCGLLPMPETAKEGEILAVEAVFPSGSIRKTKTIPLPDGNAIKSIALDANASTEEESVYRITMTDGSETTFSVKNGKEGKSAYEYALEAGYSGNEGEFAEKLAASIPQKMSELEMDLFATDVRKEIITLAKENFSPFLFMGNSIYAYFGPEVSFPDSLENLCYQLTISDGNTAETITEEHAPIEVMDGGFSILNGIVMFANGVAADLAGEGDYFVCGFAPELYEFDTVTFTLLNCYTQTQIPDEWISRKALRLHVNGTFAGAYDGSEAVDVDLPMPKKASELENDVGYLTEHQALPVSLPNPNALTINGIAYDGSEPVEITVTGGGVTDGDTESVLSDNLFDKATVTTGQLFYHSNSGPVLTDSTDVCYAYVSLRGAGTYRTKVNYQEHQTYSTRVPILTEDKTFLQNVTGTVVQTDNRYAANLEFTITEDMIASGAALYAFDCHTTILNTVMIVKDIEYPSAYIPYGYIEVPVDNSTLADKQNNVLKGRTAVFLGDSICAGTTVEGDYYNYGWGGIIGQANRMTWKNFGKNGGTITDLSSVDSYRWLTAQATAAASEFPDADYVIFEGGCNDADVMKDALLGSISDDYATFDTTTFSGALESLILQLVTAYPHAKIGYIIPQKMYEQNDHTANGHVHRRFFDRAIEICEKWGISYIDLWKTNPMNPKLSTASRFYTDGQHLTLAGYQKITPQIEAWMRTL